jgi:DNA helicase II / ATP-dependent DNA helicase PcrA
MFSVLDCVTLVADPRQSVLSTNRSSRKNKSSSGLGLRKWAVSLPSVIVEESRETWRFGADIAAFSDRVLDPQLGYSVTRSRRYSPLSIHEGVFAIAPSDVPAYLQTFPGAVELRAERRQAVVNSDAALTFGVSKGLTFERTVVYVQKTVQTFLHQCAWAPTRGIDSAVKELAPKTASNFYVAVTRAEKSVALVLLDEVVDAVPLPRWAPQD